MGRVTSCLGTSSRVEKKMMNAMNRIVCPARSGYSSMLTRATAAFQKRTVADLHASAPQQNVNFGLKSVPNGTPGAPENEEIMVPEVLFAAEKLHTMLPKWVIRRTQKLYR